MNRRLAICLVALLVSAAACSTTTEGASDNQPGASAFDIFLSQEMGLIRYARSSLVAECMADQGFPQQSELPDNGPQPLDSVFLDFDLESLGPVTEEQAREDGFGTTPAPEPPSILSFDPSFDSAAEGCRAETEGFLGENTESTLSAYNDLGNQVYATFASRLGESSEFRDALGQLVACMSDKGFPPDDREALLNDLEMSHFGIEFGQVVYEDEGDTPTYEPGTVEVLQHPSGADYRPTSEEVELALVFVECRTTTGFNEVVGTLISRIQAEVFDEYEAQFIELNPQIEELARSAAEATGLSGGRG